MSGFVYVLVNSSIPDLVKVGMTVNSPQERASALSGTGTPGRFIVAYQVFVRDPEQLERDMHRDLDRWRDNSNREFFRLPPHEVIDRLVVLAQGRMESDNVEQSADSSTFPNAPYLVTYEATMDESAVRIGALAIRSKPFDAGKLKEDISRLYKLHDLEVSTNRMSVSWTIRTATKVDDARVQLLSVAKGAIKQFVEKNSSFELYPDEMTIHQRVSRSSDRHALTLFINQLSHKLTQIAPEWDQELEQQAMSIVSRDRELCALKGKL